MLAYARSIASFHRDARLYLLVIWFLGMGVSAGITAVLLNIYLLRLGYGPETIGAVNSVSQLGLAISALPAAHLGRRFGNRRMVLIGLGVVALGNGLVPLAEVFTGAARLGWLLVTPGLGSVGFALVLVNEKPFIMSVTNSTNRNLFYSLQGAIYPLAGFAGSLAGGFLPTAFASAIGAGLETAVPYRYPLLIAAGLVILALVAMSRTHSHDVAASERYSKTAGGPPTKLIIMTALVVFTQIAGEIAARLFLNVYLDDKLGLPTTTIGTIAAVAQLVAIPAALTMPLIASRIGTGRGFVLSTLGMIGATLLLSAIPDWRAAGLSYVGVIAFASIARPCIIVIQMELVRQEWRSSIAAGTTLAYGLSSTLIAFAGGQLIASVGYSVLFAGGGLISLIGVALFVAYFRAPRGEYAKLQSEST